MIATDYHMHSFFSGDCDVPTEEMLQSCIQNKLTEICFTEHNDPEYPCVIPGEEDMFLLNTEAYHKEYLRLREKYANALKFRFGVELGVQPGLYEMLDQYLNSWPFDFVIASSHACQRKDPYYPYYYDGITIKQGILYYFEEILENVSQFKNYDVYGHLDYLVRYIPKERKSEYTYRFEDFRDVIEAILKTIIADGKGIELNTGGFHKEYGNFNPCPEIIKFYKELGGEIITVGADAHKPEDVGCAFDKAELLLKEAGFKYYHTFKNREIIVHDLK